MCRGRGERWQMGAWSVEGFLCWNGYGTQLFSEFLSLAFRTTCLRAVLEGFRTRRCLDGSWGPGGHLRAHSVLINSLLKDHLYLKQFCWENVEGLSIRGADIRPPPGLFLYRLPPHFPLGFPGQKGRTSCLNFKASVALILFLAQWR